MALAAIALVLLVAVGVIGVVAGGDVQQQRDSAARLQEREQRAFQEAPAQFGANLDPAGARHDGSLRMSYIGASVTRGWYVTSIDHTFPAVASRIIAGTRSRDVDWHVVALPGAPVGVALKWTIPKDQDIVVIHLISDDFLYGTPIATYQKNYLELLAKIRQASPKAGFVCLGDWGRTDAVNQEGAMAYTYENIAMAACRKYEGVYVPLSQDFEVTDARGPKGHPSLFGPARGEFHPNDYGDQLIAQSIIAGIDGDPAIETVPAGPGTVAPAPIIPQASPGAKPSPVKGHESHTAPPLAPVKEPTPRVTPTASPTA
ncbi:MAG: GDSL-type esterase/lipase family protein [Candidatus Dormiibacterota bacterium]